MNIERIEAEDAIFTISGAVIHDGNSDTTNPGGTGFCNSDNSGDACEDDFG